MKKKLVFTLMFIVLIFVLFLLSNIVFASFLNKLIFEKYIDNISNKNNDTFYIDKIVLFSSCSSDSAINSNNTITISNLSQYTDIAIFIDSSSDDFSLKNTLKSVCIKDISFNILPKLGTPHLYYKSLTDFATPNVSEDNVLNDSLTFDVSSDDEIDYSEPTLFNNRANPITFSYVNSNIKSDYTFNSNSLVYDGSLLKNCNVILSDLHCAFSFTICVENNLGEYFVCPVYLDIPLENTNSSIYDGNYTYIYNPNYSFYSNN